MTARFLIGVTLLCLALVGCRPTDPDNSSDTAISFENTVAVCSDGIWDHYTADKIHAPAPDSEGFVIPVSTRRNAIKNALAAFWLADYEVAVSESERAGYRLCRQGSSNDRLTFWHPATRGEGHARWVVRHGDAVRPLVIQAPHGVFDTDTMVQSVELFDALNARALIVNAAHRCANTSASSCSGTTSVCGISGEGYRESDLAHTVESFFQVAHVNLMTEFETTWAISMHGMADDGFSVSNGTTDQTTADSPSAQLARALTERMPDQRVTTCNDFGLGVEVAYRLCGSTNVQGRYLNNSPDACTANAA
ncbi:MAG: hypothetical protein WEB07_02230, partial [Natronospirillum sp.]